MLQKVRAGNRIAHRNGGYFLSSASLALKSLTLFFSISSTPVSMTLSLGIDAIAASPLVASSCIHLDGEVAEWIGLLDDGDLDRALSMASRCPSSSSKHGGEDFPFLPGSMAAAMAGPL